EGGIPAARPAGGAIDELLEIRDPRERLAMALGDALELDAMVEGKGADLGPVAAPRGRPMDMIERLVVAQRPMRAALLEEMLQLDSAGTGRRAAVARDNQRPAGIGDAAGFDDGFIAQIPAEKPAHEGIAGPQDVVDL